MLVEIFTFWIKLVIQFRNLLPPLRRIKFTQRLLRIMKAIMIQRPICLRKFLEPTNLHPMPIFTWVELKCIGRIIMLQQSILKLPVRGKNIQRHYGKSEINGSLKTLCISYALFCLFGLAFDYYGHIKTFFRIRTKDSAIKKSIPSSEILHGLRKA